MTSGPNDPPLRAIYLRYMALRVILFVGTLAVLVLVGVGGWVLEFVLAAVISGLLAYPLAARQRRDIVRAMQRRRGEP